MADFKVPEPILNSPSEGPLLHWWTEDGSPPPQREGLSAPGSELARLWRVDPRRVW